MSNKPILISPDRNLRDAYIAMANEYFAHDERYGYHCQAVEDFERFMEDIDNLEHGAGLPFGFVPMSSYWMVDAEKTKILGEIRIRHYLNPSLEIEGGHIGYAIRPTFRHMGYGTLQLAMALPLAYQLGITRVLITCDTDNFASARVIEKNGGIFTAYATSPRTGKQISQYWISMTTDA